MDWPEGERDPGEEFAKLYVLLWRTYNLPNTLSPPEALRANAVEYQRFLSVVFSPGMAGFFEREIRFLLDLARMMDGVSGGSA